MRRITYLGETNMIPDDVQEAKREASLRFLAPLPEVPQFAALTITGIREASVPLLNVHAVGIGRKEVAGQLDATLAVRFYVLRKVPLTVLPRGNVLPASIGGVPTDVIESPPANFATSLEQRLLSRPVRAGVSIAHPAVGAGTLGAICRSDPDDGRRFALSNNHVLANLGRAAIGDVIVQPAPVDATGNMVDGGVAQLTAFEPIDISGGRNRMDGALAEFLPGLSGTTTDPIGIGTVGSLGSPDVGTKVVKSGRTTGVTKGVMTDVRCDVLIPLRSLGLDGSALFEDVLRIDATEGPVAGSGDSGALFLTDDSERRPVGLLFAEGGGYALACKLAPVLERFEVVIA